MSNNEEYIDQHLEEHEEFYKGLNEVNNEDWEPWTAEDKADLFKA